MMAGGAIYGGMSVPRPGIVTVGGNGDDGLQQETAAADANGKDLCDTMILKCKPL
jgi:uncharacterized protein YbbK (DUF523 family)